MSGLQLENITKRYGSEVAVDNLSLSVSENQVKALLGPSGCGKTTLLRLIAGFEELDEGKIYIGDEVVSDAEDGFRLEPQQRDIGMVFQSLAIWPHMTVKENLEFPLSYVDDDKADHDEKINEVLETVGLGEYKGALAPNLSGGQRQRVALARALVTEPDIILFDEPLTALDSQLRRTLRNEINRICNERDVTALYVTHSQDEAMYISDRLALMNDGQIVEENDPITLYKKPGTFFGMNFMGRSNKIPCGITSVNGDSVTFKPNLTSKETTIRADGGGFSPDQDIIMSFRPKACNIVPKHDAHLNNDQEISFEGTVVSRGATRDTIEFNVDISGEEILVHATDDTSLTVGDSVVVSVDPDQIRLFDLSQDYEY